MSCTMLQGYASGSFGPTTAGRMDSYVDAFQQHRASMVMLAKGNRSKMVSLSRNVSSALLLSIVALLYKTPLCSCRLISY